MEKECLKKRSFVESSRPIHRLIFRKLPERSLKRSNLSLCSFGIYHLWSWKFPIKKLLNTHLSLAKKYFCSLKMPIIIVPVVRLGSLLFSLFMRFISIFMVISLRKQTHACFQHHFLDEVLKNELFCQSGSKVLLSITNHQVIRKLIWKSVCRNLTARTNLPTALMADKCECLGSANPFL